MKDRPNMTKYSRSPTTKSQPLSRDFGVSRGKRQLDPGHNASADNTLTYIDQHNTDAIASRSILPSEDDADEDEDQ